MVECISVCNTQELYPPNDPRRPSRPGPSVDYDDDDFIDCDYGNCDDDYDWL